MSRFLKPIGYFAMSGLLLIPFAAKAVTFTFDTCGNTSNTNQSCGTSAMFTQNGITITATAFASTGSLVPDLYAKNTGGDELGLGLIFPNSPTTDADHEIIPGYFIQLDISQVPPGTQLMVIMDSTTSPDAFNVWDNSTSGSSGGTTLFNGTSEAQFTITPGMGDTFVDFSATNGDVLLNSVSFTAAQTPEPSGLALLGTGILGLAGVVRRRLKV